METNDYTASCVTPHFLINTNKTKQRISLVAKSETHEEKLATFFVWKSFQKTELRETGEMEKQTEFQFLKRIINRRRNLSSKRKKNEIFYLLKEIK